MFFTIILPEKYLLRQGNGNSVDGFFVGYFSSFW